MAGYITTGDLIGSGIVALRGQMSLLRDRPESLPDAVEEFLRCDGPVNPGTARSADSGSSGCRARRPGGRCHRG
ncbi:hypothetical protein [Streptomyces sp. NPDC049590]|uniref:hypothetical protein n=1 Tax=Streptomyces sp. NPDC049590 TaxID=3154834 RepID=UPI003414BCE2